MNKENILRKKIASRLKELRTKKQLSQIKTAKLLNIGRSTIAKYETGVSVPKAKKLIIFAKFFEVSTDYILGLKDTY